MSTAGRLSAATKVKHFTEKEKLVATAALLYLLGVFAFKTSVLHVVDKDETLGAQKNTGKCSFTAGFLITALTFWCVTRRCHTSASHPYPHPRTRFGRLAVVGQLHSLRVRQGPVFGVPLLRHARHLQAAGRHFCVACPRGL